MKDIREYINESIRLDEAKKVKVTNLLKDLDKIDKWNSENNIKNLIASYMSAGDAEDLDPKHWDVCTKVVSHIVDLIKQYIGDSDKDIDIEDLTNEIAIWVEDWDELVDLNKKDKEVDWDADACIDLFNTVSMKVCKDIWLN